MLKCTQDLEIAITPNHCLDMVRPRVPLKSLHTYRLKKMWIYQALEHIKTMSGLIEGVFKKGKLVKSLQSTSYVPLEVINVFVLFLDNVRCYAHAGRNVPGDQHFARVGGSRH